MLCYRCGSYNPDGSRRCAVCGQAFSAQRRASRNLSAQPQQNRVKAPLEPGSYIADRYRVVGGIAQGAVGWVLRARDEEVDLDVAVKLIAPNLLQTDTDRATFGKAVKLARRIQHQNVARIYEDGEDENYVFYTMPYLEGLTLRKILDLRLDRGQVFTVAEALPLFGQLALGLDNLEKLGHHGGVRPTSIVVMPDILKVTGVPHWHGLPRRPFIAQLGHRHSVEYLAPEARRDDAEVDSRADVFSMAVIFGEMLTGHVYGRDANAWGAAVQRLPGRLAAVLSQALSEEPRQRFSSAGAFFDGLAEAVADMQFESSEPVPLSQPTRPKSLGDEHTSPEGEQPASIEGEQSGSVTPAVVLHVPSEAHPTREGVKQAAPPRELARLDDSQAGSAVPLGPGPSARAEPKSLAKQIPDLGSSWPERRGRSGQARSSSRTWVALAVAVVLVAGATAGGILWFKSRTTHVALPPAGGSGQTALTGATPPGEASGGAASGGTSGSQSGAAGATAGTGTRATVTTSSGGGAKGSTPAPGTGTTAPANTATTGSAGTGTAAGTGAATAGSAGTTDSGKPAVTPTTAGGGKPPAPESTGTRPPEPSPATAGQRGTTPAAGGREVASLEKPPPPPPEPPPAAPPKERCPGNMVEIKGGSFQMGSSPSDPMRNFGELDPTSTAVAGFCIDIYEYPNQRGKTPTTGIAWAKAKQLCEKQGKRLCSEAEWEDACKGGRNAVFPFGNSFQAGLCNIDSANPDKKAVGSGDFSRCRSGYGIADLAGNVAEWTSSRFADDVPDKVVKGGSADQASYTGRCAARANEAPSARRDAIGFRCCADL